MCVVEPGTFRAHCAGMGQAADIDMSLIGPQPVGTWVLTFLGAAREVLDPLEAARICDALTALQMAMNGETPPDYLIADLIDREPQLPDFLRAATAKPQGAA
jgi:hydrogenase expression/formation protein HypC